MPTRKKEVAEVAKEEKKAPAKGAKTTKTEKRSPLATKVKKFFAEVDDKLEESIYEIMEQQVKDSEGNKENVMFVRFSDDVESDEINEEFNVAKIKEVLYHYHTTDEKLKTGKAIVLDVIPVDENNENATLTLYVV